jgi:hypothetical protein
MLHKSMNEAEAVRAVFHRVVSGSFWRTARVSHPLCYRDLPVLRRVLHAAKGKIVALKM